MASNNGIWRYSRELKVQAVQMFFERGMTRGSIAEALGIRESEAIRPVKLESFQQAKEVIAEYIHFTILNEFN